MIRKVAIPLMASGTIIAAGMFALHMVKAQLVPKDVKVLTEKWMGDFLDTSVRVSEVEVGFLKHLSLGGLEIERTEEDFPFLIGVKQIVVRYDWTSLLKRKFQIPAKVLLEAPYLTLNAFRGTDSLFDTSLLASAGSILTQFEFREGEIKLPWLRLQEDLKLSNIYGRAIPKKGNLFDIKFKGELAGVASGSIDAEGSIEIQEKKALLVLNVAHVTFSEESQLPIRDLSGSLRVEGNDIRIDELKFRFRNIPCRLSGKIDNATSQKPVFEFSFEVDHESLPIETALKADFVSRELSGHLIFFDQLYEVAGRLEKNAGGVRVEDFIFNDSYQGAMALDFEQGLYQIQVEEAGRRAKFDLDLNGFSGRLEVQLDHFEIFGYDLVTFAALEFEPDEPKWAEGDYGLNLNFETDYVIFENHLLRDFQGGARLSPSGLTGVAARWGNVSELRGGLTFEEEPQVDLVLRLGLIELEEFQTFGIQPLPRTMRGAFEGKLNMTGNMRQPDIEGSATIRAGKLGRLEFDRALIQFAGRPPYLKFNDSKAWRGRHTFGLKGGLDFSLRNMFKGVRLVNSERVVLWKGIELSRELEDLALASDTSNTLTGIAPVGAEGLQGTNRSLGKLEMEYRLGDRASLGIAVEEDQATKDTIAVGPKVKF